VGFRLVWSLFRVSHSFRESSVLFEWSGFVFVHGPHSGFVRGSRSWTRVGFVLHLFVSRALFESTGVFLDYRLLQVFVRHGRSLTCAVFVCVRTCLQVFCECSSVVFRLRTVIGCVFVGDSTVWYVFVCVLVACVINTRDCTDIETECNAKIGHRFGRGAWREEGEKNRARVGQTTTTLCLAVCVCLCSQLGMTCAKCTAHVCCSVHCVGLLRARGSPSFFLSRASVCVGRVSRTCSGINHFSVAVAVVPSSACHTPTPTAVCFWF